MNFTTQDKLFMHRAMDLALLGQGKVSPNPMVGCVVVCQGGIIGEGWHRQYGGPHAEVHAIQEVERKDLLRQSTAYVSLEPCAHHGKTPPCTDLLLAHGIKEVIVANPDPNPLVAGKGLEQLRQGGVSVKTGLLAYRGEEINKRFFTAFRKERPYLILKWAETADGFVARSDFSSKWISDAFSRRLVHKWRSEEDAILVGSGTARHDNPQLTTRDWPGPSPIRLVIDRHLQLDPSLHLFDQSQTTLVYNLLEEEEQPHLIRIRLPEEHFIESLLYDLFRRKIYSVIIEGGATLQREFLNRGLWDEIRCFKSKQKRFGEGIRAPQPQGTLWCTQELWEDLYFEYRQEPPDTKENES